MNHFSHLLLCVCVVRLKPVLLNLLPLLRLLLGSEDVLALHSDLETLAESTVFAESAIRQIHAALLVVQALEVLLQCKSIHGGSKKKQSRHFQLQQDPGSLRAWLSG